MISRSRFKFGMSVSKLDHLVSNSSRVLDCASELFFEVVPVSLPKFYFECLFKFFGQISFSHFITPFIDFRKHTNKYMKIQGREARYAY